MGPLSGAGVGLNLLCGEPQRFFLIQGQFGEAGRLLDRPEAPLELAVGFTQSRFRFDVEMACEVDDGKKQVAELVQLAVVFGLGIEFGQFLVDLDARA